MMISDGADDDQDGVGDTQAGRVDLRALSSIQFIIHLLVRSTTHPLTPSLPPSLPPSMSCFNHSTIQFIIHGAIRPMVYWIVWSMV